MINFKRIFLRKANELKKEVDDAEIVLKEAELKIKELKETSAADILRQEILVLIKRCNWLKYREGQDSQYPHLSSGLILEKQIEIDSVLKEMADHLQEMVDIANNKETKDELHHRTFKA